MFIRETDENKQFKETWAMIFIRETDENKQFKETRAMIFIRETRNKSNDIYQRNRWK